jgi:hypothetical protein
MQHPHVTHQLATERRRDLTSQAEHARQAAPARRRRRRALFAALLPAALAVAVLPGAADASSAGLQIDGTLIYIDGGKSDDHQLSVAASGSRLIVTDNVPIANLVSGSPCTFPTPTTMSCPLAATRIVSVNLGEGDDIYTSATDVPTVVNAGGGSDIYKGGFTDGVSKVSFAGGSGFDRAFYGPADSAVSVTKDESPNDGRAGRDGDNIHGDVEWLIGSRHADTLIGDNADRTEFLEGMLGDDQLFGNGGNDVFRTGRVADGADRMFGGGGEDTVTYAERARRVTANLSDGGADDGEAGEGDEIRQVETAHGGSLEDTLRAHPDGTTPVTLIGHGGSDTITGARGGDILNGGSGRDTITANAGNDRIQARDGESDTVVCGSEFDTVDVESGLDVFSGCEKFEQIGVLRLADKVIDAETGKAAPVTLSWRHPDAWRKLRSVTLRLTNQSVAVGEVTVHPRAKRINADGVAKVARRGTRLTRRGKTVTARLALRIDASMVGQKLGLEVEATDKQGRRQLETNAGTVRVGG